MDGIPEIVSQGAAALGGALGAFIGQFFFVNRRMRKVIDSAIRRELVPMKMEMAAIKRHLGWKERADPDAFEEEVTPT